MLLQIRKLPADDPGNNVAHPIVIADLLMLIPRSVLAALSRPLADFIGIFKAVGQEHSACTARYDLISIKGNAVIISKCTSLDPPAIQLILST